MILIYDVGLSSIELQQAFQYYVNMEGTEDKKLWYLEISNQEEAHIKAFDKNNKEL